MGFPYSSSAIYTKANTSVKEERVCELPDH